MFNTRLYFAKEKTKKANKLKKKQAVNRSWLKAKEYIKV
jgi:hypothetical protein